MFEGKIEKMHELYDLLSCINFSRLREINSKVIINGKSESTYFIGGTDDNCKRTNLTGIIQSFDNVRRKIMIALEDAIEGTYEEGFMYINLASSVGYFGGANSPEELKVYYAIENALFRIVTLWDLLAHFCDVFAGFNVNVREIKYKTFFSKNRDKFPEIYNYITSKCDLESTIDLKMSDNGTHNHISKIRNKLLHVLPIGAGIYSTRIISGYENPEYTLELIIHDFIKVYKFFANLIDEADSSLNNNVNLLD